MSLAIEKSPQFHADEAGEEVAWRFYHAVDDTVLKLARKPDLGWVLRFRNPALRGLWSFRVESPFTRFLIFYRVTPDTLEAWRLMHGARDLPRRLLEPPGAAD